MKYFKKIEGDRIYLSPVSIEDIELYAKWLNDRKVTDGIHGTRNVVNVESERNWFTNTLEKGKYTFGIVLKDNDQLIGNIGFSEYNGIDRSASLGIFIGEEEYRSNGYGAEAIKLLIKYGFDILNLHSIELGVYNFNERAIACYKKVGFKECGRRHECYFLDGKYYDRITMEILEKDYRGEIEFI